MSSSEKIDSSSNKFPNIPGFDVKKVIGTGGMSVVYEAVQANLGRTIALKILNRSLGRDPDFMERFRREGRSIAMLGSNQHIVTIYDMGTKGEDAFIAMEYLPGKNLKELIDDQSLSHVGKLQVIRSIADALTYAHTHDVIHRDVKPLNILFRANGTPVLTDFGIARMATPTMAQLTSTGIVIGTPRYMSPEQVEGKTADERSDIYSLGVIFYEMLVGKVPYEDDSAVSLMYKHVNEPTPQLPKDLEKYQNIIDKMMAKNPKDRFQSCDDFVNELNQIQFGLQNDAIGDDATILMSELHKTVINYRNLKKPKATLRNKLLYTSVAVFLFALSIGLVYQYNPSLINRYLQADTINHELSLAMRAVAENKISKPDNNNAILHYKNVLLIDRDNSQALHGINVIVDQIENKISSSSDSETIEVLASQIDILKSILADNDKLEAILSSAQKKTEELKNTANSKEKVHNLLLSATQLLKEQAWLSSKNKKAVELLNEVLRIDPGNVASNALLSDLRTDTLKHLKQLEQTNKQTNNYNEAINIVEISIEAFSDNMEFKDRLIKQKNDIENRKQANAKAEHLIAESKKELKETKLSVELIKSISQKIENAFSLAPNSQVVKAGLRDMLDKTNTLVNKSIQDKELNKANRLFDVVNSMNITTREYRVAVKRLKHVISGANQRLALNTEIDKYLSNADISRSNNNFIEPENQNALHFYNKALNLDSSNHEAANGLEKTLEEVLTLQRKKPDEKTISLTLSSIDESLALVPINEKIASYKLELEGLLEKTLFMRKEQKKIIDLFKSANKRFAKNELIIPEGESAYDAFINILEADPQNEQAKLGLTSVSKKVYGKARELKDGGAFEKSTKLVDSALTKFPENSNLIELKKNLDILAAKNDDDNSNNIKPDSNKKPEVLFFGGGF